MNRATLRLARLSCCGEVLAIRNLPYDRSARLPLPSVEMDPETGERLLPAYTVGTNTHTLEAEKQACFHSKSLARPGLPDSITSVQLSNPHRTELMALFRACVMDTAWLNVDREHIKDVRSPTAVRHHLGSRILLNLQRALWAHPLVNRKHLLTTCTTHMPHLISSWERHGNRYQVSGRLGFLESGREPLPPFAVTDEVEATRGEEVVWDDIISPLFDMHKNLVRFSTESSFNDSAPYPYPQTLTILPRRPTWPPVYLIGQAVWYCFAHALAHATQRAGARMGDELSTPIMMRSITFDGTHFYFVCFQLNTLNFESDDGVKNLAWIEGEHKFYHRACASADIDHTQAEKPIFERRIGQTDVSLEGFNEQTAELFIKFMLYPVPPA